MGAWEAALDAAGITDPGLRADYTRQRVLVAAFKPADFLALRLLLPPALLPHVVAAVAFGHHTDTVVDTGSVDDRTAAYARWEKTVGEALDTGGSDDPIMRPLLRTMRAFPVLRPHVEDFLAGVLVDLEFDGFATEADYQRYVDAYSLPFFMSLACLLAPDGDPAGYRAGCRSYIDGAQRLDFVNDLAEDLAGGRLTLPLETLRRHGVAPADLTAGTNLAAVAELIRDQLEIARRDLADSRQVVALVPPAVRPVVGALIDLEELTLDAALARGAGLLRGSVEPSKPAAVRLLLRAWWRARRAR